MGEDLRKAYRLNNDASINLGGIVINDQILENAAVNLVLKSFNRHGLIAGATGTGKTKTMQVLAEQLSVSGIPSLVMDIKGDISGLGMTGVANEFITKRCNELTLLPEERAFAVELYSLIDKQQGTPLRSTVSDFGSLLFARMLDSNETQAGVITILFEFARETNLPLINLDDFKALLRYAQTVEGKSAIEGQYGAISSSSIGTITRKIIELEAQGGDCFFAEPAFNIQDLLGQNSKGEGVISILRLMDVQDKPKLFSTLMLKLLTDIYRQFPELGDPEKPKLVLFIDEAHLLFNQANRALLDLLNTIVKLIRSKGVGLIFCTQMPNDIPDSILSQLGLKIQHALRAFTAKDRQMMRLVAQNFPPSEQYDTEKLLTSLSIGDALVCALDEKGLPTPLIQCRIRPPQSRMGVLSGIEVKNLLQNSSLYHRYNQTIATPAAAEILSRQATSTRPPTEKQENSKPVPSKDANIVNQLSKNTLVRQLVRQFFRQITDQIFRALGIKKNRR